MLSLKYRMQAIIALGGAPESGFSHTDSVIVCYPIVFFHHTNVVIPERVFWIKQLTVFEQRVKSC